jgi:hypothetical protein
VFGTLLALREHVIAQTAAADDVIVGCGKHWFDSIAGRQ